MSSRALRVSLCLLLIGVAALGAEVRFSELDLSAANQLLFRATADSPGFGRYNTLFLADLESLSVRQLTFFPERITLLEGRSALQVQNRFGVFRTDRGLKGLHAVKTFPSFVREGWVENGKVPPLQASPNGAYLLSLRRTSDTRGDLILYDLEGSGEFVVSRDLELSLRELPAAWSADSSYFVYSKQGQLYYLSVSQLLEKRMIAESYRRIGEGGIRNVRWSRGATLYYVSGSLVYELDSRELFTRALYAGYLAIGRIVGKIPFTFDSNFDSFWVSPDGMRILLNKGGRNLFLYLLSREDFHSRGQILSLPYLYLPRGAVVKRLLWNEGGTVTVLTEEIDQGNVQTRLFRLPVARDGSPAAFRELKEAGLRDLVLSPDGSAVALLFDDRVELRGYEGWDSRGRHRHDVPLAVKWLGEEELVIAGRSTIEVWNVRSDASRLVALSQSGRSVFSADGRSILAEQGGSTYRAPADRPVWSQGGSLPPTIPRQATDRYRVYLEEAAGGPFQNIVMIRDTRELVTRSLPQRPEPRYEPFPQREEPVDFDLFAHGSRLRRREIALVFNVIDSIEGLPGILSTLHEFGIRATFFVNGEAIRRYPGAVKEIADSGHEVGSLFYTYFDMTDTRFQLDKEFIKQGLARNEDEFFEATGGELALLWHAPYYVTSSEIIAASREMNYTYVGRDVDSLDWVARDLANATPGLYKPAAALVARVLSEKKPGSIVPVLAGVPPGRREDYLFQKLDLLIDGLLRRGYSVVPVSQLIEHAR